MRTCDYCGKANEDAYDTCAGCGCSLNEPKINYSFPWAALLSWGGLLFSTFINIAVVYGSLPVFFRHENLGPGTIFYFIGLSEVSIITFLVGAPGAIIAIRKKRRRIGWLGLILALTPAPLGFILLSAAMHLNGLQFE